LAQGKSLTPRPKFVTPKGVLVFPTYISSPDATYGGFSGYIRLEGQDGEDFLATLSTCWKGWQKQLQSGKKKVKSKDQNTPWLTNKTKPWEDIGKVALDYIETLKDGEVVVKTKLKESYELRDGTLVTQQPSLFDAKGKPITDDNRPQVGAGTVARISGQINCWFNAGSGAGMTLWCEAVQIIELCEFSGRPTDAEGFGFTEESGFVTEEEEEVETFADVAGESTDANDEPDF